MKKIFFCCLLTGFLTQLSYAEDNLGSHFGISVGLGYVAENIIHKHLDSNSKRVAYAALLGSIPGLIKELSDNEFSGEDMAADVVGALAGSIIANRLNRRITATFQKKKGSYFVGFEYRD